MIRTAICLKPVALNHLKQERGVITLTDEIVIKDYACVPGISLIWQIDRTPITDPEEISKLLEGLVLAEPLPCLGVFLTQDVSEAFRQGRLQAI